MLVCLEPCAVHAPNLERLAGRGLTFIHAYCQQAICSPSRNSFLSGFRPQRTKGQQHKPLFESRPGLSSLRCVSQSTIAC